MRFLTLQFHHCPLLKAWQDLGFNDEMCAKLCDIAMDGDRNIAKAMGLISTWAIPSQMAARPVR